jgi:hypothetical protein
MSSKLIEQWIASNNESTDIGSLAEGFSDFVGEDVEMKRIYEDMPVYSQLRLLAFVCEAAELEASLHDDDEEDKKNGM